MASSVNFYFHAVITGSLYAPVNGPKYDIVAADKKTSPINRRSSSPMDSICYFHLIPYS